MTQYNLLIMLNDPYIKLATLFLNSLYKNTDLNREVHSLQKKIKKKI